VETIRFIGHVFPRGVTLNAELPDLDLIYQEGNVTFSLKTKINNSTINAECSVEIHRDNFCGGVKLPPPEFPELL
jgi:hypothetical protein